MKRQVTRLLSVVTVVLGITTGCINSGSTDDSISNRFVPNGFEFIQEIEPTISEIRNQSTGVHYYLLRSYNGYYNLCPVVQDAKSFKVTKNE